MIRYALGAIFIASCLMSAGAAPPPVEAFGDLPRAKVGRLSPDGKHLAVLRPVDGTEKVVFYDLSKTDAEPYTVGMEGGIASDLFWKTDEVAVVVFHANISPKRAHAIFASSRAVSVNIKTRAAQLLMYNAPYFRANFGADIADLALDDPGHIYMTELDRWDRQYMLGLYKVDVATGLATLSTHGTANTIRFLTDHNGHVLGRIDQDWDLTNHVIVGEKEALRYRVEGSVPLEIEGLTAGANPVFAVKRPSSRGTMGLYGWSPAVPSDTTLFEDPAYDIDDVVYDDRTARVIGATWFDDLTRVRYLDPALQHVQDTMEKAFPGEAVSIVSHDKANATFVVASEGPRTPPVLSLYTTADHKVNVIEEAYPALKPADLGEVKPYPYKARDGLDIHAYLTLPPGREAKNLPVVIFPHGGPEARDTMDFDWWSQFMATRGYAVLQPNFRGSSGYGLSFVAAGDGEWAGKVQYDVQDGVKKLIADGIADPRRICIVGGSYGGYMALAGATFSPDLYACAISFAGLSDLGAMLEEGTSFQSENASLWRRRIGSDKDSGKLRAASPSRFADRVRIPVLLLHSEKDATVQLQQSAIEADALKRAGKTFEFVVLDGDDHYLEFPEARIKMLKEIERFLEAHIGH